MTDNHAIQLISGLLLSGQGSMADEPQTFAKLGQKYPYFVPIRYIKAKQQHQHDKFSQEMLNQAYPYICNPILFSNYLEDAKGHDVTYLMQEEDIEVATIAPEPEEVAAETIPELITTSMEPEDIVAEPITAYTTAEHKVEYIVPELLMNAEPERIPDLSVIPGPETIFADDTDTAEEVSIENPLEVILIEEEQMTTTTAATEPIEEPLFAPVFSEDYFLQQGIKVSGELPEDATEYTPDDAARKEKALMVMMSFKDWLLHFKSTSVKQQEEIADKKAVKTMWQKEKMAAAIQEENEEIPENVFEMAVNSITSEEGLASESLAEIHLKQQKYDKAIEMYRKLSLRNPEKNAYFAQKIKDILKEKEL